MIDVLFSAEMTRLFSLIILSYVGLIWLTMIVWVISDSIRRSHSFFFQLVSALFVTLFNVLGLIIYIMIRPNQTLQDAYDEELEREFMLKQTMGERCAHCKTIVKNDYMICPVCTYQLKSSCKKCKKLIKPSFRICPYCSTKQSS